MRIVMIGTGGFAEPTFQALLQSRHDVTGLVTNPDRPSGKEREMIRPIKQMAVDHGVPVFQPESINTPEGVAGVQAFNPDLLVVAAYGQILSNSVLNVAPRGGINVHASLLPKYRGAAPIAWAIYHGEKQTGVTIIQMSTRMDAGDMLAQDAVDIPADETAGELETRLAALGARMTLQVIDQLEAGTVKGTKQDLSQVTKAPKLKKEHGLIDWTRTAEQVCNQIRAMQPWPTAYTFLHRKDRPALRIIINEAVEFPVRYDPSAPVGLAFTDNLLPNSLFVRAGLVTGGEEASVVELHELQPAGKRRMETAEFLRGHPIQPGDRFGEEQLGP